MRSLIITWGYFYLLGTSISSVENPGAVLIGVLSSPIRSIHKKKYGDFIGSKSIVTKSVKDWVDHTGAIPVFIPYDAPLKLFDHLIEEVHGFVIPGCAEDAEPHEFEKYKNRLARIITTCEQQKR